MADPLHSIEFDVAQLVRLQIDTLAAIERLSAVLEEHVVQDREDDDGPPDGWADCRDCGVDTNAIGEFYIVRDDVWPIAPEGGMLCVGCLEERIGRPLEPGDFTDAPFNWEACYGRSWRLVSVLPSPPPCAVCGDPGVRNMPEHAGAVDGRVVCPEHYRTYPLVEVTSS
jgi:hypothetical protein